MSGQPLRLAGRLEVDGHVLPLDSRVKRRLPVRELDAKPEHVAVVLDASEHVPDNEQGGGFTEQDWGGHGVLSPL